MCSSPQPSSAAGPHQLCCWLQPGLGHAKLGTVTFYCFLFVQRDSLYFQRFSLKVMLLKGQQSPGAGWYQQQAEPSSDKGRAHSFNSSCSAGAQPGAWGARLRLGLELRVLGHRQQHQGQVMVGGNHPHLALKSGWFSLCWAWLEQRAAAKLSGFGS